MASELALQIARRNKETTETIGALRLANDVDAELSEAREALDHLLKIVKDAGLPTCPACERAAAVADKLKTD